MDENLGELRGISPDVLRADAQMLLHKPNKAGILKYIIHRFPGDQIPTQEHFK